MLIQRKTKQVSVGLQVQENATKGYRCRHHLPDLLTQYALLSKRIFLESRKEEKQSTNQLHYCIFS